MSLLPCIQQSFRSIYSALEKVHLLAGVLSERPMLAGALLAGVMLAGGCAHIAPQAEQPLRDRLEKDSTQTVVAESATFPYTYHRDAIGSEAVVVTAHPLASEAGLEMLRMGGNAVDASVAAAFALAVLEPNMSGLGGSGALTLWMASSQRADYLDYYAATGADPDYRLDSDDSQLITPERGVAVPGMVAGLMEALETYGTLDRRVVLEPAIRLAKEGFTVHHLLAHVIEAYPERLHVDPAAAAVFYPDEEPLRAGETLVQPALANVLERIAAEGRDGFYSGPVARQAIERLQQGESVLTLDDFRHYRPVWRGALCEEWNGYRILTAPPSLAGHEVIMALKLFERRGLEQAGHPVQSSHGLVTMTDALRIARAERSWWDGDPAHVPLPVAGVISDAYAALRVPMMYAEVTDTLAPGDPWIANSRYTAPQHCTGEGFFALDVDSQPQSTEERHAHIPPEFRSTYLPADPSPAHDQELTTHLSVVDQQGNAVSMTNTLGLYFGTGVFSDGVFYNSAADNFGAGYGTIRGSRRTANSSTAPTIMLSGDQVALVVGSPGSTRIPPTISQVIAHTLLYGLHPSEAIRIPRIFPHIHSRDVELERGFSAEALEGLNQRGYRVVPRNYPMDMYFGGVQLIRVLPDGTRIGVTDPRRDGAAAGY